MDNNLADDVEDGDNGNEGDQAMQDCLRNPVIVRKILEHVSSKELLQISLVNKLWKYEARSVVRKRGNLIANLRSNQRRNDGRKVVEAFVSDLNQMSTAPFTGISIDNDYESGSHICARPSEALVPICDVNLDQLLLKSISVKFNGWWPDFNHCPAVLLSRKLMQRFCGVLEELEVNISAVQEDFIEKVVQDCKFPRLKTLDFIAWQLNEGNANYIRVLMSRAPNLKILKTNWKMNSAVEFFQGTSAEFVHKFQVRAPFDEISENVISMIKFENLELKYSGPGFNFERFNRIAPTLLQASCTTTLRVLSVDAVLAVSLMCFGIRLENVPYLRMDIDYGRLERIEPRILNIVKNFDFTRTFPNLEKVHVDEDRNVPQLLPGHMNDLMEQANAYLSEPILDRAAGVKKLLLTRWHPSSSATQFYVKMFPNIEKLEIVTSAYAVPIPFWAMWNWLDLEGLEVRGNAVPTSGNLDSVFCGIFPDEVAELRLKDEEYLKKVNIVPVMPAITCLKNLRRLFLHHEHYLNRSFGDDATFMFSKVTALLVFARRPALAVSVNVSAVAVPPAMTHLKPYMSVTSDLLKDDDGWDD